VRVADDTCAWSSQTNNTSAGVAVMQDDGNFVVYDGGGVPVWNAGTWGHNGAWLEILDDEMAIVAPDGTRLWVVSLLAAAPAPASAVGAVMSAGGSFGGLRAVPRRERSAAASLALGVLALAGLVVWRSRERRRPRLQATALLLPVLLFVPATVLAQSATEVIEYYHLDALGTVRVVTDAGRAVVRHHDFKPFGEEIKDENGQVDLGDRKLFTGQERDTETGLDYFRARYYRSDLGRFTTVDPLGGHLDDPQSLNAYDYARNNPLPYTDPTGLDFHLSCGERSATCQPVSGGNGALVQGTTGANGAFTPTVITSASLTNPTSGNTAVVNGGGVLITTGAGTSAQKTSQGIFINGTAAADIAGDPKAAGWSSFTFHINSSDLSHGVLAEGTAAYHGRESDLGALLKRMGAFSYPEEFFGNPFHPGAGNFRFSQGAHPDLFNYGPSPHFLLTPRVPTLGFHVDSRTGPAHISCAVLGKGCF
jgi:RHS repeat-associated protein